MSYGLGRYLSTLRWKVTYKRETYIPNADEAKTWIIDDNQEQDDTVD